MSWGNERISELKAVLWLLLKVKNPARGATSISFKFPSSRTIEKLLIDILMLDARNLVCRCGKLWVRSSKYSRSKFFCLLLTIGTTMQKTDQIVYHCKTGKQVKNFQLRPWWEKFSLHLRRENVRTSGKFDDRDKSFQFWLRPLWKKSSLWITRKKRVWITGWTTFTWNILESSDYQKSERRLKFFSKVFFLQNCITLNRDLDETTGTCSYGLTRVRILKCINNNIIIQTSKVPIQGWMENFLLLKTPPSK